MAGLFHGLTIAYGSDEKMLNEARGMDGSASLGSLGAPGPG